MACIGTWSFSLQALQTSVSLLEDGKDCVFALEAGINGEIENDKHGLHKAQTVRW